MAKKTLNELEKTTLPNETPILLAAQNGHADASFLTYLNQGYYVLVN